MAEKIIDFFTFFVKLSPSKMINIVLLGVIFFVGWWSWDSQMDFKKERDDYKVKYDSLYQRYTLQVDKNQQIQNQLKDDCGEQFKAYQEKKDAEIKVLVDDFNTKYIVMVRELNNRYYNKNN